MATNVVFSPKEFEVAVQGETTAGSPLVSGMFALDVDSISMPSLNVNQSLEVRGGGTGRTFKSADFFQDNVMRVSEISLSGRFHDDDSANGGHIHLLRNITGTHSGDITVPTGYTPDNIAYDSTGHTATHFDTFTLAIKAPSQTNGKHMVFGGCVCTNFVLSADMGTDGGQYKWSATIQTGKVPDLDNSTDLSSNVTAYTNNNMFKLPSATDTEVNNADVALQSFSLTIDNPAIFAGVSSTGYQVVNRGAECSVTVDCQVKYDDNTDELIHNFDIQGVTPTIMSSDAFLITASNAGGIEIENGVFTNVSLSEGDMMMLDISIKSVDDGTDPLVSFDF